MSLENTTGPVSPDPEVMAEAPALTDDISPEAALESAAESTQEAAQDVTQDAAQELAPASAPELSPVQPPAITGEPPRGAIAEWALTILLLLFLTTTLVQAYVIPSGSMEDSLLIGDHLLVDKLAYAPSGPISKYILPYSEPKRGDIIVFRYPEDIRMTFVKRAIGIPGDRIRVVNKEVYRNGVKLDEPYKIHKSDYVDPYRDNFPSLPDHMSYVGQEDMLKNHVVNGEVVVPPDMVFAMGDNRDNSSDSRYWGFVPRRNIIGKPLIIYWSYNAPTDQLQDSGVSASHFVDLVKNFFPKTRWARTFKLIHGYPSN